MGETTAEPQWLFLVDPMWAPADEHDRPPVEAVVGGWLVDAAGEIGRFEPNEEYKPATPDSPTDPVDAALRLVARGEMDTDALFSVLRGAEFGVAMEDGVPVVAHAPDDVLSLLVTTAPAHRNRVNAPVWRVVTAAELAELLAEHEADALFNPGATTSIRLTASAVADAVNR